MSFPRTQDGGGGCNSTPRLSLLEGGENLWIPQGTQSLAWRIGLGGFWVGGTPRLTSIDVLREAVGGGGYDTGLCLGLVISHPSHPHPPTTFPSYPS